MYDDAFIEGLQGGNFVDQIIYQKIEKLGVRERETGIAVVDLVDLLVEIAGAQECVGK